MQEEKQRTIQQNKSLHLYCRMLSDALNEAGLDMLNVMKPDVDMPWSGHTVKEFIYKPILEALTGKSSTMDMDTCDPSDIYEIINRHTAEKFGISVEWPSRR